MPKSSKKLTPGQKKLKSLGVELPYLPTTTVGSFPKHAELAELRYKVAKGVQPPTELSRKEKISAEIWLKDQERLGLDILVNGEMERSDLVSFFAKKISGFDPGGTVRGYGNRYYKRPIIKQKLEWQEPITLDMWRFVQRMTHKPVKAVISGPYTLMDWSFNEYYSSREAACRDLAAILRKEIAALNEAGAKIIQIDEPALTSRPEEFSLVMDGIKEIIGHSKSYFILHACYGDLPAIWKKMERLPVDNFSLEMTNTRFSYLKLLKKWPTDKDISVGFIDSHNHNVETPQQVAQRIRLALSFLPIQQVWVSPDCGLKTRSVEETLGKLGSMVKAAQAERNKIKK